MTEKMQVNFEGFINILKTADKNRGRIFAEGFVRDAVPAITEALISGALVEKEIEDAPGD